MTGYARWKEGSMNLGFQMECPKCKSTDMRGAGGSFGGRITMAKRRCCDCGLTILVVPMEDDYEYVVSAKTPEEIEQSQKDAKRIHELQKEIDEKYAELSRLKSK